MNEVNMTGATELLLSRVRFEDRSDIRPKGRIARGGLSSQPSDGEVGLVGKSLPRHRPPL